MYTQHDPLKTPSDADDIVRIVVFEILIANVYKIWYR